MEYQRLSARAFPPPSTRCSLGPNVLIHHIPLLASTFPPHSHSYLASEHVLDANVRDGFPVQFMRVSRLVFAEGGRRMGRLDLYGRRRAYPGSETPRLVCARCSSQRPRPAALSFVPGTGTCAGRECLLSQPTPILPLVSPTHCLSSPRAACAADAGWQRMRSAAPYPYLRVDSLTPVATHALLCCATSLRRTRAPAVTSSVSARPS
jgi:hypothetical protein